MIGLEILLFSLGLNYFLDLPNYLFLLGATAAAGAVLVLVGKITIEN